MERKDKMDALEQAKQFADKAYADEPQYAAVWAQLAQAYATIALVERLDAMTAKVMRLDEYGESEEVDHTALHVIADGL